MFYYFNRLLMEDRLCIGHLSADDVTNVNARYNYWVEMLMQRASRLFEWKNLPDNLPQFEIEQRYVTQGFCVFTKKVTNELDVFYGNIANLTGTYFDIPLQVNYHSPTHSGILNTCDYTQNGLEHKKECVFGRNTASLVAILPIAEYYAGMLAHTDSSFVTSLIHDRLKGGVPTASTKKSFESAKEFYKNLKRGKVGALLDIGFASVKWQDVDLKNNTPLNMYTEVQQELISRFYNDIGVKTARKKKGNMIQEEVDADGAMLLVNIAEMLEQRKRTAKELNDFYGTNISVDISEEIKKLLVSTSKQIKESVDNVEDETDMR